jgi:hypothetical protein
MSLSTLKGVHTKPSGFLIMGLPGRDDNLSAWARTANTVFRSNSAFMDIMNKDVYPTLASQRADPPIPDFIANIRDATARDAAAAAFLAHHAANLAPAAGIPLDGYLDVFDLSPASHYSFTDRLSGADESSAVNDVRTKLWKELSESLMNRSDLLQGIIPFDVKAVWEKIKLSVTTVSSNQLVLMENAFRSRLFLPHGRKDFESWLKNFYQEFQSLIQKGSQTTTKQLYIQTIMLAIDGNVDFDRFVNQHQQSCQAMSIQEFHLVIGKHALQRGVFTGVTERAHLSEFTAVNYSDKGNRPSKLPKNPLRPPKTPWKKKTPEELAELKKIPCELFAANNCKWGDKCHKSHKPGATALFPKRAKAEPEVSSESDSLSSIHIPAKYKYYTSFTSFEKQRPEPMLAAVQLPARKVPVSVLSFESIAAVFLLLLFIMMAVKSRIHPTALFVRPLDTDYSTSIRLSPPPVPCSIPEPEVSSFYQWASPSQISAAASSSMGHGLNWAKTFLDSGASSHNVVSGTPAVPGSSKNIKIDLSCANSSAPMSIDESISTFLNSGDQSVLLQNAFVCPHSDHNLVSVGKWDTSGGAAIFANGKAVLVNDLDFLKNVDASSVVMEAELVNGMYEVKAKFSSEPCSPHHDATFKSLAAPSQVDLKRRLHQRFGHCPEKYLNDLFPEHADVMMGNCDACSATTQYHSPQSKYARREPTQAGEIVQVDSSGKLRFPGSRGHKYVTNFWDKHTNLVETVLLHTKDAFLPKLVEYEAMLDRQGTPLKTLQMDRGTENTDSKVREFLKTKGVRAEFAGPQEHASIGGVEGYHNRQFRGARAMLAQSGMPKQYITDTAAYFTQIKNRMPRSSKPGSSPLEMARKFEDPYILSDLHVYGCEAWAKIDPNQYPDDHHVADQARRCVFLGISEESKDTYVLLEIKTGKRFECSNVKFNENVFPFLLPEVWKRFSHDYVTDQLLDGDALFEDPFDDGRVPDRLLIPPFQPEFKVSPVAEPEAVTTPPDVTKGTRTSKRVKKPQDFGPFVSKLSIAEVRDLSRESLDTFQYSLSSKHHPDWPRGLSHALRKPNYSTFWRPSMVKEVESWTDQEVLGPWVKRTEDMAVLALLWIFKTKVDPATGEEFAKSRCCAGGDKQTSCQYGQTYAPTLREESLFILLIHALDHPTAQLATSDVHVAYLNALMDKVLYCTGIPGFELKPGYVRRVLKAVYGTKQAQKLWRDLYCDMLVDLGFRENQADQCVFSISKGDDFLHLGVHVDDFISLASTPAIFDWFVTEANKRVELSAQPFLKYIGLNFRRSVEKGISTISFDVIDLITAYLEKADMLGCNPADSPYIAGFDYRDGLLAENEEEKRAIYPWFNEHIGTINYITKARKDLLLWCHLMSRVQHNPGRGVIPHVKKVQRYLRGTLRLPTTFTNESDCSQMRYSSDASHAALVNFNSTGATIAYLGKNVFFAKSVKQRLVTVSSTAAEIVQLDYSSRHAHWATDFCADINMPVTLPVQFDEDNSSAIQLFTGAQWKTTRWIGVRYHSLIEKIKSGFGFLNYVPTDKLISDHLTKPSKTKAAFMAFRDDLLNVEAARRAGFV